MLDLLGLTVLLGHWKNMLSQTWVAAGKCFPRRKRPGPSKGICYRNIVNQTEIVSSNGEGPTCVQKRIMFS